VLVVEAGAEGAAPTTIMEMDAVFAVSMDWLGGDEGSVSPARGAATLVGIVTATSVEVAAG
jgi:hypothetical protein